MFLPRVSTALMTLTPSESYRCLELLSSRSLEPPHYHGRQWPPDLNRLCESILDEFGPRPTKCHLKRLKARQELKGTHVARYVRGSRLSAKDCIEGSVEVAH